MSVAHSCLTLFVIPWAIAHQAPLSMGFLRQEYWSGLPFPSPGDLPNSGIKPEFLVLAGGFFTTEPVTDIIKHAVNSSILKFFLDPPIYYDSA